MINKAMYVEEDPQALQRTMGMGRKKITSFDEFVETLRGENGEYKFYFLTYNGNTKNKYNPQTGKEEEYPVIYVNDRTVHEGDELENAWCNGEFYYCDKIDEENKIFVVQGL